MFVASRERFSKRWSLHWWLSYAPSY